MFTVFVYNVTDPRHLARIISIKKGNAKLEFVDRPNLYDYVPVEKLRIADPDVYK